MSEYQYYEFLAVDRALSKDEQAEVRALSTRARITSTSFTNEYHWGDFHGDTTKMVERLYDLHLYYANWGSRRLVMRLPSSVLSARTAAPYALEEVLRVWTRKGHTLLDFSLDPEDAETYEPDYDLTLSDFVGLRAELASGDLRGLYVAWLAALQIWELADDDEEEYAREYEPPVPSGLAALTGPQQALADFLCVEPAVLAAAAERSSPGRPTEVGRTELAAHLSTLPESEKDKLLLDDALGVGPRAGQVLLARCSALHLPHPAAGARRSAAELLDAAYAHRTGAR